MMGQATKEVFNTAVDHINCETIRFIHREAGRAEAANNMDCLSFESIYKSIPTDEAGTTGALCKNINDYKNKYKEDKPLDEQLNAVIAYANAKIAAKKRKGNVDDFKASLEKIKKDALDAAKGTSTANTATPAAKTTEKPKAAASDTSQAISEPAATANTASNKGHKTDWLGLLALLVGLGALGLAYMAYSNSKKSVKPGGYENSSANDNNAKEIQRVEKYFRSEIAALQEIIQGLVQNQSAQGKTPAPQAPVKKEGPIGYIKDESAESGKQEKERSAEKERSTKSEEREKDRSAEEERAKNEERRAQEEKAKNEERRVQEEKAKREAQEAEAKKQQELDAKAEELNPPSHTGNDAQTGTPPPASHDLFGRSSATQEQQNIPSAQPETKAAADTQTHAALGATVAAPEPFMPEKEYEDGEAVPFYKFTGLPNEAGYFESNSFTDEPEKDSVYEIEMYEDVPEKAFFSIRSNADVIRRAIQDPQTYLAPCCTYTDDPAGKHTIVLVEEGMLRKENNRWVVYEKAKINFE